MIDNEIIYITKDPNVFSNFPLDWHEPSHITNAILYFNTISVNKEYLRILFEKLNIFNCQSIELRVMEKLSFRFLELLFDAIDSSRVRSFYLILKDDWYNLNFIEKLIYLSPKLININIYNSKQDHIQILTINNFNFSVSYFTDSLLIKEKTISISYKNINLKSYIESKSYNLYHNRKLIINTEGIVFYPSLQGKKLKHISSLGINDLGNIDFSKYWSINNDLIDVCKVCEFRYMCVDPRCPIQRENKSWFYSTECDYNPYIAMWKGDDGYLPLAECGVTISNAKKKINYKKLNSIQEQLWN